MECSCRGRVRSGECPPPTHAEHQLPFVRALLLPRHGAARHGSQRGALELRLAARWRSIGKARWQARKASVFASRTIGFTRRSRSWRRSRRWPRGSERLLPHRTHIQETRHDGSRHGQLLLALENLRKPASAVLVRPHQERHRRLPRARRQSGERGTSDREPREREGERVIERERRVAAVASRTENCFVRARGVGGDVFRDLLGSLALGRRRGV